MKILLINPPFYRFIGLEQDYVPISLLSVASEYRRQGHDVYIKNLEISKSSIYVGYQDRLNSHDEYLRMVEDVNHPVWIEYKETLAAIQPDIVGLTILNVKFKSAMVAAKIAHDLGYEVIAGGAHVTIEPNVYPSYIKLYPGEFESKVRVQNLDDLSFPYYESLLDVYSPNGYAHIISSRGCPFECKFCASNTMWGRKVTFKSPERIIKEMKYIHDTFKSDYFTFWDETFTLNRARINKFCELYDVPAKWRCDTRADQITDDLVKMMKNSGCGQMSLGIESGRDHILKSIGKNETLDTFIKAADILNSNKVEWKAYCIIGFPEETEDDILETVSFIKSLKPYRITPSFFTPYVGTELYNTCIDNGMINHHYDHSLYAHQSPHNYFCPKIPKNKYVEIRNKVSKEIDMYNKISLETWK